VSTTTLNNVLSDLDLHLRPETMGAETRDFAWLISALHG